MKEEKVAVFVATWFRSGLIRPIWFKGMAGTYGSLATLPFCLPAIFLGKVFFCFHLLLILVTQWLGMWSVPIAEKALGSLKDWHDEFRIRDQNQIVIDEVTGTLIACAPLCFYETSTGFWGLAIAFGLFRLFDAKKFWPANHFDERADTGSVILDDVIAGLYAAMSLTITLQVIKLF